VADRLDASQLELLWTYGQARVQREHDDLLALFHAGAREGMTDVYVSLKQLRRRGGRRPGAPADQAGLTGTDLDQALDRLALRFPERMN
jgi:hypothetical protein